MPLPERLKRAPAPVETAADATGEIASEAGQLSRAASAEWRAVLGRLNLADPQDIQELTDKLANLEAKLDELSKAA